MKKRFLILLLSLSTSIFAQEPKVILVTLDGVRWKEVFRGAEKSILENEKYTSTSKQNNEENRNDDSIKSRELLMSFT